jgi:superfamily II DNA helicase RecQ
MKINYAKVDDWVNKNDNYSFGGMKLKPMQMAIINCNKSKDVIVNLPTGFGKSLLFQYPASTLYDKTIIVFVPLRALLWDCLKEAKSFKL